VSGGPTLGELNITVNAGDSEARVRSLSSSLDQLARKERERTAAAYADRFQTDAQARSMGLAEIEARRLDAAMSAANKSELAAAEAAAHHSLSLGRVEKSLERVIVEATGANEQVALLSAAFGHLEFGAIAMIGALAGGFAAVKIFEAWHEGAEKAREEQDKLTESLTKWYDKQKEGAAGELPKQIDAMTKKVKELREEMDKLTEGKFLAGAGAVGTGGSKAAAWLRIFSAGDATQMASQFVAEVAKGVAKTATAITEGGDAITAATKEAAKKIEAAAKEAREKALADEIAFFKTGFAGPETIATMQTQVTEYSRMAAQFAAAGDVAHAIEYAKAAKELTDALDPLRKAEQALWEARKTHALQDMRNEAMAIVAKAEATDKETKSITDNVVAMQKQLAERFKQQSGSGRSQADADRQAAENAAKYAQQMRDDWIKGIDGIITHGLTSFSSFFESVLSMFRKMLADMEKAGKGNEIGAKLLGLGSAAIGGGLAGYQIGHSTGSAVTGALGGAASGALAGSAFGPVGTAVGAVAGFVGGIIGAGQAAKEAAKHMAELQASLALNIASIKASLSGDVLGQAIAKVKADFDALRKQTEDAYSGGGAGSEQVRNRNTILAQLNALEAQRIQQLRDEAALVLKQLNENVEIQILRNNGLTDEADAMEKAIDQERRFTELRKQGISEDTIARLRESEATRDAAEKARKEADAAAVAAAQAIEDAAKAAQDAADAAQKAFEQARATQDLDVELLKAQGRTTEAADLEFQQQQQRRLEDAKKLYGDDSDFVSKLQQLQQIQRDQRAVQGLIDSTTGPSSAYGSGANAAQTAVTATVTERTSLMIVDILRAIEFNTRGGAGGGGTVVHLHIARERSLDEIMDEIRAQLLPFVNEDIGTATVQTTLRSGSVRRN
jgi:hypothetical protein